MRQLTAFSWFQVISNTPTPEDLKVVLQKLARARVERGTYRGRDQRNFEVASHLVATLEEQLSELLVEMGH